MYLAQFDALRIPQEAAAFAASPKPALVRGLWRDHRHAVGAVTLMATLMLDYRVNDTPLWVAVLGALRGFGAHRFALRLLGPLFRAGSRCARMDDARVVAAIQDILFEPLSEALAAARSGGGPLAAAVLDAARAARAASSADGDASAAGAAVLGVLSQVAALVQAFPAAHALDTARFATAFAELAAAGVAESTGGSSSSSTSSRGGVGAAESALAAAARQCALATPSTAARAAAMTRVHAVLLGAGAPPRLE
jgi:hypothetical protein